MALGELIRLYGLSLCQWLEADGLNVKVGYAHHALLITNRIAVFFMDMYKKR